MQTSELFSVYNSVNTGVMVIDNEFNIVFWNTLLESLSGTKRSDILGKSLLSVYPHLDTQLFRTRISMVLKSGIPHMFASQLNKYIIPCKLKDGGFRVQDVTVVRFVEPQTQSFFAVFTIKDVTEETSQIRKLKEMRDQALLQINERIKTEEKMRDLIAAKEKLYSIISHDLKSPLSVLIGYSQLLIDDLETLSQAEIRQYIGYISSVSSGMSQLIENLLSWSLVQQGGLKPAAQIIHVDDLVEKVVAFLDPVAKKKSISLTYSPEPNAVIQADTNMIETSIRNLVSNSIKYTHENGHVALMTLIEDNHILILVVDNGVGIPAERIRKLFKTESSTSTLGTGKERGTGLGLLLCKEFIEKNGGRIHVESVEGKGSTFTLVFPLYFF